VDQVREKTMEWTTGNIMFYGGLAGAAVTLLAAIIAAISLARGNKRIKRKLDQEYGDKL